MKNYMAFNIPASAILPKVEQILRFLRLIFFTFTIADIRSFGHTFLWGLLFQCQWESGIGNRFRKTQNKRGLTLLELYSGRKHDLGRYSVKTTSKSRGMNYRYTDITINISNSIN